MSIREVAAQSPYFQAQAIVTHLPREITLLFLRQVAATQVASMRRVCRYFSYEIGNQDLWKLLFQRDFPHEKIPKKVTPSLQYERCYRTETNWRKGQYVYQRLSCGPVFSMTGYQLFCRGREEAVEVWDLWDASITHLLDGFVMGDTTDYYIVDGDYLIGGAHNEDIFATCVWNTITGDVLLRGHGHGNSVFDGTKVFIPYRQFQHNRPHYLGSIQVWLRNSKSVTTLVSDPDFESFAGFQVVGDYLYATTKGFVRIWNKETGALVRTLGSKGDNAIRCGVKKACFEVDGGNLICGCTGKGKIKIWKIEDGTLLSVLTDPQDEISSIYTLKVDEDVIMAKCQDLNYRGRREYIACWDKKDGTFRYKIETHGDLECLDGDRFIVVLSKTFEIRNKYTGALINICEVSEKGFFEIQVDTYRIFSMSIDGVVKIWDKETGDVLFVLNDVTDFKVIGNRMVIVYPFHNTDICDFSYTPELPFPQKGQLSRPPAMTKKRTLLTR